MNMDFHYYATHLAARLAGFDKDEALTICYACLLVDRVSPTLKPIDSPSRVTYIHGKKADDKRPKNIAVDNSPKSTPAVTWSREAIRSIKEIWQYFHFLPGNEFYTIRYEGPTSIPSANPDEADWHFSGEDNELFRQVCQPNSIAVLNMVEDTKSYRHSRNFLHLIGVRMHVLADTWAHQNFIAMPKRCMNEVDVDSVRIKVDGKYVNADLGIDKKDNLKDLTFQIGSPADSFESASYLGHTRIGGIPDYACLEFEYRPFWAKEGSTVKRNNRELFCRAFHQLYYAMKCIREDIPFDPDTIPENFTREVMPVFNTWKLYQSREWNDLIKAGYGYALPEFTLETWYDAFENESGDDYALFIRAADHHVDFVYDMTSLSRFEHTSHDGGPIRHSSVIHYLDWDGNACSAVCAHGKMYVRTMIDGYPKGNLQQVEMLEYRKPEDRQRWKVCIDQSSGVFRHIREDDTSSVSISPTCTYYSWEDGQPRSTTITRNRYLK